MDELKMLGTALAGPDPSPDTVDRSRHRLQNTMRGGPARPRSGRRTRWIAAGVGLAAAGAAAAVVVSDLSAPDSHKKEPVLSGRQVMLAAATTAESKPAASGTYWHTKTVQQLGKVTTVSETWTRRDGSTWLSVAPGLVSRVGQRPLIRGSDLDYTRVQRLPTDPGRLRTALLKSTTVPAARQQPRLSTINLLQAVLVEVPAPPKVRAAAYRALAAMPHIDNLGRTAGGYRLRISYMDDAGTRVEGTETIVVDPKSTQLRVEGWAGFGGGDNPVGPSRTASGWTDGLPGRIVPWKAQEPYIEKLNEQLKKQGH
ncbi:CU044_5270 family protein [Actinomadura opuntiae]|uniref:CU044_5270 family protein n=1 Tax=Actinomadura sp. OS1-43 TaxID=604315 RepID=UPI00255AB7AD|nr:CU044_5270 family protein [Actinomadura sp. OS1-43]MDL4813589.1 CU044_5270 family protein [Actinomadura sp. OS1-43]